MDEDHTADPVRNAPEDDPAFDPAAVGDRQRDSGPSRQTAEVAHVLLSSMSDGGNTKEMPATTKRTDVYTPLGHEYGCCGHRHRTVREAGRCLEKYRRREYSDRIAVAVAADTPWPPAAADPSTTPS